MQHAAFFSSSANVESRYWRFLSQGTPKAPISDVGPHSLSRPHLQQWTSAWPTRGYAVERNNPPAPLVRTADPPAIRTRVSAASIAGTDTGDVIGHHPIPVQDPRGEVEQDDQDTVAVLRAGVRLLGATSASVWLAGRHDDTLICTYVVDRDGACVAGQAISHIAKIAKWVATHRRSLVIPEVGGEVPESGRADTEGEALGASACVPLLYHGRTLGVLYLFDENRECYTDVDLRTIEVLAMWASWTIGAARQSEEALEQAILDERQRLAANLHDAINQSLFSAGLIAEALPTLLERRPGSVGRSVQDLRLLINGAAAELREVLAEMRPTILDDAEFGDLLHQLAGAFSGRTGVAATVETSGQGRIAARAQAVLYRICREAFANIAKHAGATHVWVRLTLGEDATIVSIADDGCGFDAKCGAAGHHGLTFMQEWARKIGADVTYERKAGGGSEVTIYLPSARNE
jgi:signal transduction histidine kinase